MLNQITHAVVPPATLWWESLSPQWQQAFIVAALQNNDQPGEAELQELQNITVLRLAGPDAPHSNCNVLLTDLSGIKELHHLQLLIVTHHAITSVAELASLKNLRSLFLFNNLITNLQGIEELRQLEQLYVNSNELSSIKEIEQLTNLQELYVSDNRLTSLEGLTAAHAERLKKMVCLPNEQLKQSAIIYAERELGIICR